MIHDETPHNPEPVRPPTNMAWMFTLSDLVSLLLVFFVMVYAMTEVESEKWSGIQNSLADRMAPENIRASPLPSADRNAKATLVKGPGNVDYLANILFSKLTQEPLLHNAQVHRFDDRLILSLPMKDYFEPGLARMKPEVDIFLKQLVTIIDQVPNRAVVASHAPVAALPRTSPYPSVWELTTARAVAVSNRLKHNGLGRSLAVIGRGDSRLHDLSDRLTFQDRAQWAERVDIEFLNQSQEGARE